MHKFKSPLWPLFFVIYIDTTGYFLVMPILMRLLAPHSGFFSVNLSHEMRNWLYGLTLMLSPLAFIVFSPIAGRLSDRFGRKKLILGCLINSLLGFIIPIIGIAYHHISLIMLGRFIAGIGTTSQPVAQAAITDFSKGKDQAMNLALIGLAMTLALVSGPLLGTYLSDSSISHWFSLSTPYLAATILTVINIILLLGLFNDQTQALTPRAPSQKIAHILSPAVVLLAGSFFFLEISWSLLYQGSYFFLHSVFHYATNQISRFASFLGLMMSLGLTVIYRYSLKRMSVNQICRYSLCAIAALMIIMSLAKSVTAFWLTSGGIALFIGTAYPSLLQLICQCTPSKHHGLALGFASTLLGLAWMLTGLFAAALTVTQPGLMVHLVLLSAIVTIACYVINTRWTG